MKDNMKRFAKIYSELMNSSTMKRILNIINCNGWYMSHRTGDTGIGKTLEDLAGIKENNFSRGDIILDSFEPIELKSARVNSSSMITLFTKSPEPRGRGIKSLLERFGYFKDSSSKYKELHSTLSVGSNNIRGKELLLKVIQMENNKRICFIDTNSLNEKAVIAYYSQRELEKAALRKLSNGLVLVEAEVIEYKDNKNKKVEFFKYTKATFFYGFSINSFFELLEGGKIKIDFRLGTYKSGKKIGKPHDHGTAFRISAKNLLDLFEVKQLIASI